MVDRQLHGVYADNARLGMSARVYRDPDPAEDDGERVSVKHYTPTGASYKRIVRWMLDSEQAGAGRCFLQDETWCYESAWAVSQIGK